MLLTPAAAYTFVILGLLLVYAELIRPGTVFLGTCGVGLVCLGAHGLWQCGLRSEGLALCVLAAVLFCGGAIGFARRWLGGLPATVALIAGSLTLCRNPVPPFLAIAGSIILGATTTVLLGCARRARRNKSVASDHGEGTERQSTAYS